MSAEVDVGSNLMFSVAAPIGLLGLYVTMSVIGNAARRVFFPKSPADATKNAGGVAADLSPSEKRAKQSTLAQGYTSTKRYAEIVTVLSFAVVFSVCLLKMIAFATYHAWWLTVLAFLGGNYMADFASGLVHWALDTWGSTHTAAFGSFIRSFREHHVDPHAITRHDLVETNADNMMICVPFLFGVAFLDCRSPVLYFTLSFLTMSSLMVALTNQFHSWAHEAKPPAFVRTLQRMGLILSPKDHQRHHHEPFDCNYTITNGWLNGFFERINFWKHLENLVVAVTGAQPRQDDAFWRKCTVKDLENRQAEDGDPVSHIAMITLWSAVTLVSVRFLYLMASQGIF